MSSTITAPHTIPTSCPPDDVSLLPNHGLHPPTAPLLIPPPGNPNTSHPFAPSVTTSPLTPHISAASTPTIPIGLGSATTTTTRSGTSNLPAPSKWRVSPSQREILQAAFDINPYPELNKKTQLAAQLGVTTTQVSKWFQHRRETLTRLGQFKAQYNRTRRTPEQLRVLQEAFAVDRYPSAERLAQLESQLDGVTAKQIKLWFKHRRKQALKPKRPKSSTGSLTHGSSSRSSYESNGRSHHSKSPQCHPSSQSSYPGPYPTSSAGLETPSQPHHSLHSNHAQIIPETPHVQPAPSSFVSSVPSQLHTAHLPDSSPAYPIDSNPNGYYGYRRQGISVSTPLSSGTTVPSSGTLTHSPSIPKSSFNGMEEMALRATQAVTDGKPSADVVSRLSRFLDRSHSDISQWFSGYPDNGIMTANISASNDQYSGVQSDAPTSYSGRQIQTSSQDYRKGAVPGVVQHQNSSPVPESQEQHIQGTSQSIQNSLADFSKHEANVSSSNNDANHQQHTERSSCNVVLHNLYNRPVTA